jgi:hypothetical protein
MASPPAANAPRLGGATTRRARAGAAPGDKYPIAVRNAMGMAGASRGTWPAACARAAAGPG